MRLSTAREVWRPRRIASVLQNHRRRVPVMNRLVTLPVQLPVHQVYLVKAEAPRLTADHDTPWTPSDTLTLALSTWLASHPDLSPLVAEADHWPLPPPGEGELVADGGVTALG